MRRQFCHSHTVRYDECSCDGFLTPTAFLQYMQDIAALDAEDAQLSGNGYWVVKRTVISFAAPVRVHARLELKTYGIGFTCITAQRGYEARVAGEQHDEPIISARTLWVYVDPFPSAGQEFTRLQQITREGRVVVRACSRWLWRA